MFGESLPDINQQTAGLEKKTIVWHQNDFGRQEIFSKFSSILLKYVVYLLKNIFRQFCIFELEIVTMSHGKYL